MQTDMPDMLQSPLLTDLYQLTMLSGYFRDDMRDRAVFEFFARGMPRQRHFLMAAGLEQAIEYLENLSFSAADLDWVRDSGFFDDRFVEELRQLKFTGDVYAMPEGTIFFPDEPILRVEAPLPEAQLVESRLINILHCQTVIASKAARCVLAAPGKLLVDFGMRRAHGGEAALFAARASYLAGFTGTATVLANQLYGIPVFGTMAHSYVQAHAKESEAFLSFAEAQPDNVVLLIDTYDVKTAAQEVAGLAPALGRRGISIKAVRLDSGDLAADAKMVRKILDEGGLKDTGIFISSSLDEHVITELLASGAPMDGFGVGTRLDTSADAPYLDCAYKLQEYAGVARRKRSHGKATWPGCKQVFRQYDAAGHPCGDTVALADEEFAGKPLLVPVMKTGKRIGEVATLDESRNRAKTELQSLPGRLRELDGRGEYSVEISPKIRALASELDRQSTGT